MIPSLRTAQGVVDHVEDHGIVSLPAKVIDKGNGGVTSTNLHAPGLQQSSVSSRAGADLEDLRLSAESVCKILQGA